MSNGQPQVDSRLITVVDRGMSTLELLQSVLAEVDGYKDQKWQPHRVEITKARIAHAIFKVQRDSIDVGHLKIGGEVVLESEGRVVELEVREIREGRR